MNFSDIVNDLVKMEGLRLESIRPGAEIVIEKVDVEQEKITIRNSRGRLNNRYFVELQRVWDALLANPMIRVEDILNGSGSSRNQPETIFANLPYIEWLRVDNKKHIAYVEQATHSYGTLRQMDPVVASNLCERSGDAKSLDIPITLIVVTDIADTSKKITELFGIQFTAIGEGIYECISKSMRLILARADIVGISSGTYCETRVLRNYSCEQKIIIAGKHYGVYRVNEFNAIVPL